MVWVLECAAGYFGGGGTILFYQGFATIHHFINPEGSYLKPLFGVLKPVFDLMKGNLWVMIGLGLLALVVVLLRMVVPVVLEGGLIFSIDAIKKNEEISGGRALMKGFLVFLPFFELTLVVGFFSLHTVLFETAFAFRNLPPDFFQFVLIPLVIFGGIAMIASLAMVYAEFFLVLEGEKVTNSIGKSFALMMENIRHTVILGLLMLTIGVRILIFVALIVGIPLFLIWLLGHTMVRMDPAWAVASSVLAGIILLYFSSKLMGAVKVLVTAAWTLSFLEIRKMEEEKKAQLEACGIEG